MPISVLFAGRNRSRKQDSGCPNANGGRHSQAGPPAYPGKLANGLTYFIRPNAEPKGRFSIRLRVNTGSLNETDDIQGVSHFLEHMVFNGSTHFKRGEMIPAMQKEGLGLGGTQMRTPPLTKPCI